MALQLHRHRFVGDGEAARDANVVVTDESMAMERQGHRPLLVEGSDDNLKVTTPADLPLAEFLLRLARERRMPGGSAE